MVLPLQHPLAAMVQVEGKTEEEAIAILDLAIRYLLSTLPPSAIDSLRQLSAKGEPSSQQFDEQYYAHYYAHYHSSVSSSPFNSLTSAIYTLPPPVNTTPPIERLPPELLHDIFALSGNFDLPIASRYLRTALSAPSLKRRLALPLLASNNAEQQGGLLRRRFFTLGLFDSLARSLTPASACTHSGQGSTALCSASFQLHPYFTTEPNRTLPSGLAAPHFRFAPNTRLPRRLLHNNDATFSNLEMLRRLFAGGIDPLQVTHELTHSGPLKLAARQGLQEAVAAGNAEGLTMFIHTLGIRPCFSTVLHVVIEQECRAVDVVYLVLRAYFGWMETEPPRDYSFGTWLARRRCRDRAARRREREREARGEQGTGWEALWIGDWVWDLVMRPQRPYGEYMLARMADRGGWEPEEVEGGDGYWVFDGIGVQV
ncbi:MAG: hypothetical protein M1829_003762 [Trizodia sp. TS-e1964]|nr:MAG: hypothetical protein M1829_003762 [Trizodia sp. TS-e1964]